MIRSMGFNSLKTMSEEKKSDDMSKDWKFKIINYNVKAHTRDMLDLLSLENISALVLGEEHVNDIHIIHGGVKTTLPINSDEACFLLGTERTETLSDFNEFKKTLGNCIRRFEVYHNEFENLEDATFSEIVLAQDVTDSPN